MSKQERTQETPETAVKKRVVSPIDWTMAVSWGVTVLLVAVLIMVLLKVNPFSKKTSEELTSENFSANIALPSLMTGMPVDTLLRTTNIDTIVPDDIRQFPVKYTVEDGDSIFVIAKKFNISAESILWANYDLLHDDPTFISPGWRLTIPPTNGVYYKWQEGDTLDKVAEKYYVDPTAIITWPGNHLDVADPKTDNLEYVMIPGGYRELVSWIQELPFAPSSGATRVVAGPGGCVYPSSGPMGSGYFAWPVANHFLSGFGYSSYHLGVDLAAAVGTPVVAADNGTVIYSGWNDSGYGNLIEIDHNNGYQTVYAHLNSLSVRCGDFVYQGQMIGLSGSTGKSTGGHLHFEIRHSGSFVNPFTVLQ